MRRAARTDGNHVAIVDALRAIGCKVRSTAALGNGFPDLIVGYRRRLVLLEAKDESQPPSKRRLTDAEADFHREWASFPIYTVESPTEAVRAVCGGV